MSEQDRPAVSFVAFIVSLARNVAVLFGDRPDPITNEPRKPDIEAASQLIDVIAMLEEKTRGNLTAEERRLIDQVLDDLRNRLAKARKASIQTVQP